MATIEERAKESVHQHYSCNGEYPCTKRAYCVMGTGKNTAYDCCECGADEFYEGYIACATERQEIDDAENGKALLYAVDKTAKRVKKEMIEKVCEWIEERKHPVLASDTDDTIVGYDVSAIDLLEWLKAMEE